MSDAFTLHRGHCVEIMRSMPDASVDAVVTDPPYELGFMGKSWDASGIAYSAAMWAEVLRVLKPGGYMLAFSGSRTYHRMVCAIEDAKFEIRDQLMWIYGSGFPKGTDRKKVPVDWAGWNTALKPAHEPIALARKAPVGPLSLNLQTHGTGALNIDACRVGTDARTARPTDFTPMRGNRFGDPTVSEKREALEERVYVGRHPANVLHDGSAEVLAAFPDAPGQQGDISTDTEARKTQNTYGAMRRGRGDEPSADNENGGTVGFKMRPGARRLDEGSAARFFYCAKASAEDRHEGLPDPGPQFKQGSTLRDAERVGASRGGNFHPTVKPTALMRYLCRLVTPPQGLLLDPFMGSGSTGKAAVLEGFRFIGIERDEDEQGNPLGYFELARARIEFAARMGHQPSLLEAA
ncbi:site-specific DNA-methyltransferase [Variovorax sp. V116]|uniref:DNA-methyltransferase n=1 Tax=Variovorax sp. V116 TaxID=3065953 RepID=UPI0034E8E52B